MTVEGEQDDICGVGQTKAAHDLCPHIPLRLRCDHLQRAVGHYGIFNGSRFCAEIAPRIATFHLDVENQAELRNILVPFGRAAACRDRPIAIRGATVAFLSPKFSFAGQATA